MPFILVKISSPKARKLVRASDHQRRAIGGRRRHCGGRPRTARAPCRDSLADRSATTGSRVSKSAASTDSVPATASSRTMSPSRSRASGPPQRGLGRDMDRGGHLARGPRHPAVGHQRHLQPAVLQHRQRRRQRVQFRHPVGLRPLKAHDDHGVGGELARLEGRLHRVLVVEDARRGLDHMPLGRHGGDLDDAAPEVAGQLLQPARRLRTGSAAGRRILSFSVRAGPSCPDQLAVDQLRFLPVRLQPVARDGLGIGMQQPRVQQLRRS